MRNVSLAICLLFIVSITLIGCGTDIEANNMEDNLGYPETQKSLDEEIQVDNEIEIIRTEAKKELGIEEIFIPEMKDLKIANAFVSYSYDEPMQIDVQYHVERGEKQEQFENEIVVEEEREKTGMKFLIPPYVNNGDLSFWFIFSKMELPEMLNNDDDGIDEAWLEIEGITVLFTNNGTDYRYYVDDENGHYMFGYNIEQYSLHEAEEMTGNFIEKIKSQQ